MTQEQADISAPVLPEGSQEKMSAWAMFGWVVLCMTGLFVAFTLTMGFLVARDSAKRLQRSKSVLMISYAMTQYEQAYNIAIASLPDWEKSLIDSGYVDKAVFDSKGAVNGKMDYVVLSRPKDQVVAGLPSWIAIYEDPRVLIDPTRNIRAVIQADGYASHWDQSAGLSQYLQTKCQEIGVPFDPTTSHLPIPDQTLSKNQNPPP
jgi:hypothetical protein